jgi:hypothetical protein
MSWMPRAKWIPAITVVAVAAAGCIAENADSDDMERAREGLEQAAEGLGDAANAMREAIDRAMEGGSVEHPLDFRVLRDFLEDEMGDWSRVSQEGRTGGALGFDVSTVSARYEDEDGGRLDVEVTDLGAVAGPALLGMVDWADVNVDEESDRGFRRTTEYEGYPSFQSFRRSASDSDLGSVEFSFFVESRFAVKVEGRRTTMDRVRDFLDDFETDDLADLKDEEGR